METVQQFEPIYGWGWHQGRSAIEVPSPFDLTVTASQPATLLGVVREPHAFAGAAAVLSLRSQSDGVLHWGVVLTGGRLADAVTGYVQSIGHTPNNSSKPTPLRGAA
jgi:hypothetical protein